MTSPSEGVQQQRIRGTIIRGGTSRGLFVRANELPTDDDGLDEILLDIFGSPDPLQIDGIGGTTSHTSKLMSVSSSRDHDAEYTFAQIGISEPTVNWNKNCGNLTSAIGMFALREGIVSATGDSVTLSLYNTNTQTEVRQTVPLKNGEPAVLGEYSIDGIRGTGARIDSQFMDPGGSVTGTVLPTGTSSNDISVNGRTITVSVVDVVNLIVFVRAEDLGMTGTETPEAMANDQTLMSRIAELRQELRSLPGIDIDTDSTVSIGILSPPQSFERTTGREVTADSIDVTVRYVTLQPHHAVGISGAMCLGAARQFSGTVPNLVADRASGRTTIGHPKGTVTVEADVSDSGSNPTVHSVTNRRTARPIMDGMVMYQPKREAEGDAR